MREMIMSDPIVESLASPEAQAQAEKMGWIPPSRFKGDPERFIDADAYIERGETVLPIVKEHNRRLEAELAALRSENQTIAQTLSRAQTAIEEIEERHTVATQKAVERARQEVKAQLAAASEAGDHEGVAELTDQLTRLNVAGEPEKKEEKKEAPAVYTPPPEMAEWNAENPWFGKDEVKTALALGIAQKLRKGGERSVGKDFFNLVGEEVNKILGEKEELPTSKVEGARGSGGEGTRGRGKSYADLPKEAREACDTDVRQFVGPTKKYKTKAEWQTRYAELYFQES
jgi:hypothetical protein